MLIQLKVLDAESGDYFETEAVLLGDGYAVYNDRGNLSVDPVVWVNGHYEIIIHEKAPDILADPAMSDKISEMAAQDFMALCE